MKILFLILAVLVGQSSIAQESTPEETTKENLRLVIDQFFDNMRDSDTTALRLLFHKDATLKSSYYYEQLETQRVSFEKVDDFIEAIGTPREELWDERISNVIFHVDAGLAVAWMDYSFYQDDKFSHCGVNVFQMVHTLYGWQILDITDTRKRNECDEIKSRE